MSEPIGVQKRPVIVEAFQFDGTSQRFQEIAAWVEENAGDPVTIAQAYGEEHYILSILTLEGVMDAKPGWWIIRGVKGEFYPCDPEVFEASYLRMDLHP